MKYYIRNTNEKNFISDEINKALNEIENVSLSIVISKLGENNTILEVNVEYPNDDKLKYGNEILSKIGFVKDLKDLRGE